MSNKVIGLGSFVKCDKDNSTKKVTADSYVVVIETDREHDGGEQKCTMVVLPDESSAKIVSKCTKLVATGATPTESEKAECDGVLDALSSTHKHENVKRRAHEDPPRKSP